LVLLFYLTILVSFGWSLVKHSMLRGIISIFFFTISVYAAAQIRTGTFVIGTGEIYELKGSDIIVVDTLIMMDSSRLKLNKAKNENYIRAKVAIFGKTTFIDGRGVTGIQGKKGTKGKTPLGPCHAGQAGRNGARGTDGGAGVNLFLYLESIVVNGNLVVDLSGGNAGDGGDGGEGGGGSPGTVHCIGGDGGLGGDGGSGGNGGKGGILTFSVGEPDVIKSLIGSQVAVNLLGGNFGYGGIAGIGGSPGLGPSNGHGVKGKPGKSGDKGRAGTNGGIQFEQQ
jgi:hypothetical protein